MLLSRQRPPAVENSMPSLRVGQTKPPGSATLESVFSPYFLPGLPKGTLKCDGISLLLGCVVSVLVLCLRRSAQGDTPAAKAAAKAPVKKTVVVALTLEGDYPEGPTSPGVFGDLQPSLATLVQRLDAAAADKNVAAVWLKIDDLAIGRAKIYELRGGDRPAAKGRQAGLCRTDHRRQRPVSAGHGVRSDRHAAVRRLGHSGRPRGNHLLQGPARQARPRVRRPEDGQVQRRRRAVHPHRHEQAAARKL